LIPIANANILKGLCAHVHTSPELRNRGNILDNVMDRPRPQARGWYVSRATCPRNLTEASGRLVSAALWRVRLASGPHRAAVFGAIEIERRFAQDIFNVARADGLDVGIDIA
jgi:hypothetical protein